MEVDFDEALNTILTGLAAVWADIHLVVQGELQNAFRRITTDLKLEAKRAIAEVHVALMRENTDVDCNVTQLATVFRNRLKKTKEASSTVEARTDVSTNQVLVQEILWRVESIF